VFSETEKEMRVQNINTSSEDALESRNGKKKNSKKVLKTGEDTSSEKVDHNLSEAPLSENVIQETKESFTERKSDDTSKSVKSTGETRAKRRDEKMKLMALVPEKDEHGIAYTKLQRRRMMKRVKRGLPAVPTPEEEAERRKIEEQLKREEEAELAGMLFTAKADSDSEVNPEESEEERDEVIYAKKSVASIVVNETEGGLIDNDESPSNLEKKKKRKRSKEVPADYTCQACKNQHSPPHWIYDCPDKVTVRGSNNVSKVSKGIHDPDEKKVFVSGLPFESKRNDIEALFSSCGKLMQCKILTFPDTGRCKGQAFLTFDTTESAQKAVALNGTVIPTATTKPNDLTSHEDSNSKVRRQELKLKVSKMLNRFATKKQRVQ
jgi:RNA recognition motif. (a.k.a. RRM, RBD, or RNP domain)